MTRRPSLRLFILFAALFLWTCAARRRPRARALPDVVAEARAEGPADRMGAIALLEGWLADHPDAADAPWVMVEAGEQRRLAGDRDVARRWFRAVIDRHPDHPAREAAVLGVALLDADTDLSGNTLATLQLAREGAVPPSMNADRYRILARLGAQEGTPPGKVRAMADKAMRYAQGDPTLEARVAGDLGRLASPEGPVPEEGPSAEEAAWTRIQDALAARRFDEVIDLGHTFLQTWPDSAHAEEVRYRVRRAEAGDPVFAGRIGVMLPLSGTYAPAGKRIRQAIELAADDLGAGLSFAWYDTAADGAAPRAGVESLVLEHGCVAILGPLLKDGVMEAAETAEAIGVPLVALSQSADPTSAGPWAWRAFLPLDQQVDALLDHAVHERAWQRFAVLYPDNPYGHATAELFAAGAEARGAAVVHSIAYDPEATDYLEVARQLGQKDYTARAAEWRRIQKAAKEAGRKDLDKLTLPPIIDFDAIFIPDNWRRAPLVASSLAYEEFPVGDFKPERHAEPIPLLGLNAWNDPRIVEAGGQYLQHAIFVDAWYPESDAPGVRRFRAVYREATGREPGLVDAVSWDAARLVGTAVLAGGDDRAAVRDELAAVSIPDPAAGGSRFGEDREVARKLLVLTIEGEAIVPWVPPEEAEPAPGAPAQP